MRSPAVRLRQAHRRQRGRAGCRPRPSRPRTCLPLLILFFQRREGTHQAVGEGRSRHGVRDRLRHGRSGQGRCGAGARRHRLLAASPGTVARTPQEAIQGLSELPLVLDAVAAALDCGTDVLPGEVGEGQADTAAVDPRHLFPAGGQPHPDLIGVVGVVVHLPSAVRCTRWVPAVRIEDLVVVGAVVEADAVVVDGHPLDGHELDVVVRAQRHRDIAGDSHERAPHLVRRQGELRCQRMAQRRVRAVLPVGDQPLIQQVLNVRKRPARLVLNARAAPGDIRAAVAGHVLGEPVPDGAERPLDMALGRAVGRRRRLNGHPQALARGNEGMGDKHRTLVDHHRLRHDHRPGRCSFQPRIQRHQPLIGDD